MERTSEGKYQMFRLSLRGSGQKHLDDLLELEQPPVSIVENNGTSISGGQISQGQTSSLDVAGKEQETTTTPFQETLQPGQDEQTRCKLFAEDRVITTGRGIITYDVH